VQKGKGEMFYRFNRVGARVGQQVTNRNGPGQSIISAAKGNVRERAVDPRRGKGRGGISDIPLNKGGGKRDPQKKIYIDRIRKIGRAVSPNREKKECSQVRCGL